jgi:hypothetical protein
MADSEFLHARTTRLAAPDRAGAPAAKPVVRACQWHHHCPRGRATSGTTIRAPARADDSESAI